MIKLFRHICSSHTIVVAFILLCCSSGILIGCDEGGQSNQGQATVQPQQPTLTIVPTQKPKLTPTDSLTIATKGPALLGSPFSNFIGTFGSPTMSAKNNDSNSYTWFIAQNGNPYKGVSATVKNGLVSRVVVVNNSGKNWDKPQAHLECGAFFPDGASFVTQTESDYPDISKYTSPAGDFLLWISNEFGDCSVQFLGT